MEEFPIVGLQQEMSKITTGLIVLGKEFQFPLQQQVLQLLCWGRNWKCAVMLTGFSTQVPDMQESKHSWLIISIRSQETRRIDVSVISILATILPLPSCQRFLHTSKCNLYTYIYNILYIIYKLY